MTKDDFFDLCDRAAKDFSKRNWKPVGVRLDYDRCPFYPKWKVWIVGPGSLDEALVLAMDIWYVSKYNSEEKATKELIKFRRWFAEWENETAKI